MDALVLQRLILFPQPFKGPAEQLVTNFDLLRHGSKDADDWWCNECGAMAELCCRRRHPIIHVSAALRTHAEEVVPRATEALQGLAEAARSAKGPPARAAVQLLAGPRTPLIECDLGLRQGDATFTARFGLRDDTAIGSLGRALLCALAKEGRIAKVRFQTPQALTILVFVPLPLTVSLSVCSG